MKLAIFFHDWIYDPKSKDNEIDSIKCFKNFVNEICLSDSLSSRVSGYIERTITHTLPTNVQEVDSDLSLFLDFDLEVLSRSDEDYALYAEQIQAEYSHLKPVDYYAGRLKVLRSLLDRDRLYFSDVFLREL
jgi:predicted metal-dependent HD superfamily phosphohydrolase